MKELRQAMIMALARDPVAGKAIRETPGNVVQLLLEMASRLYLQEQFDPSSVSNVDGFTAIAKHEASHMAVELGLAEAGDRDALVRGEAAVARASKDDRD